MMMLAAVLFAFAPQDDQPLPKIAEISSVSGDVQIVSVKGAVRKPARFGTRLKNAEIRDEDHVKTGAGAQAVIRFPDDSKFTLKENGELQVLQKNLPKATPEGNTVGRRLRLLVGDLVSEVLPNKDVRTEFESPAGSAAVRGTIVRLEVAPGGRSLRTTIEEGRLRYFNKEFATVLDMPRGSRVVFRKGSLDIDVEAGEGIEGSIGNRDVRLDEGDRLVVDMQPDGFSCDVVDGNVEVKDDADHYEPTQEDFEAAPDPAAVEEAEFFDPTAETGAAWEGEEAPPPPMFEEEGFGSSPEEDPTASEEFIDPGMLEGVATGSEGGSGSAYPLLIDDFERFDDPILGNGWMENGIWDLVSGVALGTIPPGSGADISLDIGPQATFDVSAVFQYSSPFVYPFIEVNGTAALNSGVRAVYESLPGNLLIFDGTSLLGTLNGVGTAAAYTDFSLSIGCDGTTAYASVFGSGVGGSFGVPSPG